jgi:hypothetical protein
VLTLRAVRARVAQSLTLFALAATVVAGCLVAVGYSRVTSGTISAASPLLLLGVVALAGQGASSARSRRFEIAIAQLRGCHGLRLLRAAVTEPVTILVTAAAAGTMLGRLVTRQAVNHWAGGTATFTMTSTEWLTVAAVLAISVVVVVVVSWRTTSQPLADKMREIARPASAATSIFLSLAVLFGAGVSVYQARSLGARHADWVSFLSPALLGLAAGQVGVWLVALVARAATGVTTLNRKVGWFITLRRLTRAADTASVVRIVVAAVAVAGVAGSAWVGAQSWRDSTARMRAGGAVTYSVPDGPLQAYAAAHDADPGGRWLMAMAAKADVSGGAYRDIFVDSPRWNRVVGDFFAGTPVGRLNGSIARLESGRQPRIASGNRFRVTFTASSARRSLPTPRELHRRQRQHPFDFKVTPIGFTITYVDSSGDSQTLQVPRASRVWPDPVRPGVVGLSSSIAVGGSPACLRACTVTKVGVLGLTVGGSLRVSSMSFAGQQLVPLPDDGMSVASTSAVHGASTSAGLDVHVRDPFLAHPLLRWSKDVSPALLTPGLRPDRAQGKPIAYGVDGEARQVSIAGEVPALPILGRTGILLDLGAGLRGGGGTIPGARTLIVARPDTPQSVLAKLKASGAVGRRHLVQHTLARIQRGGTAQGTLLYTMIAAFGMLIATLSVVAAVADRRRERRREAASLRLVGVPSATVTSGYRGEAELLGLAVLVIGGITVWLGCHELLSALPLVNPGRFGLPLDGAPRLGLVAALAGGTGLAVTLGIFLGLRKVGRSSPPSLLREEG